MYYRDPTMWKKMAFQNEVLTLAFPTQPAKRTVISIGDGESERHALKYIMANAIPDSMLTKSLKFMDGPSPEILRRQLMQTLREIDMIATGTESFDLQWEFPSDTSLQFKTVPQPPVVRQPPPPPPVVPRILSIFTPFSIFGESSMPYIDTYIPPSPSPPPVPPKRLLPPTKGRSVTPYRHYDASKEEEKMEKN